MKRRALAVLLCLPALYATYAEYLSASRKFQLIESERLRPHTRISLTSAELNAWVQQQAAASFPAGVRNTRLVLSTGAATGSASIDFGKVRRAQGNPPGWLMSKL